MKLNYKRIILVGFAFFLIQAFWQAYDNTIPMILTNKFGMSQAWSGAIMALDNVLALFMLPLFGAISDKHHSKWGRRTPCLSWITPSCTTSPMWPPSMTRRRWRPSTTGRRMRRC